MNPAIPLLLLAPTLSTAALSTAAPQEGASVGPPVWRRDLSEARALARKEDKPLLVLFR